MLKREMHSILPYYLNVLLCTIYANFIDFNTRKFNTIIFAGSHGINVTRLHQQSYIKSRPEYIYIYIYCLREYSGVSAAPCGDSTRSDLWGPAVKPGPLMRENCTLPRKVSPLVWWTMVMILKIFWVLCTDFCCYFIVCMCLAVHDMETRL